MDKYTMAEESYKNGFGRGYAEGLCDHAADLLKGAVRWHRRMPGHDLEHCFIVCDEGEKDMIYIGRYFSDGKLFLAHGKGVVEIERIVMWGEYRPVEFSTPELQ